ncbi:ZZ-type domain-containing protein, partial [Durusdinium trenchii]
VLAGEIHQRRLGKALPNMMKALQGLEPEVQSRFCEGVAHSLLPHMEELSQLSMGCHKQDKGKGKGKEGKQLKRSKLDYGANANQKPFSEGGGLRKFLLRLRALQEAGSMTSETLASMLVAWIPSLARIAERRSEQLKDLAQNGLNPPLQKMLAIIQEQAATTPHLKRYAAVLAKV